MKYATRIITTRSNSKRINVKSSSHGERGMENKIRFAGKTLAGMQNSEKRESKSHRKIRVSSLHFSFELVPMPAGHRSFESALLLTGGLHGNDSFLV